MTLLILLPVIYLAAVTQTTLADLFAIKSAKPDFLIMAAASWIVLSRQPLGFLAAALVGFAGDLILPETSKLGVNTGVCLLVGYLYQRMAPRQTVEMILWQVCMVTLVATASLCLIGLARWLLDETPIRALRVLERAIESGIYTGLLAAPILWFVSWLIGPITPDRAIEGT